MNDPTQFRYIDIRPASRHGRGSELGPFRVVGLTETDSTDYWLSDDKETVLFGDIPTKQLAEVVRDVYLTEYVKNRYFWGPHNI